MSGGRRGLGRGLGALIPAAASAPATGEQPAPEAAVVGAGRPALSRNGILSPAALPVLPADRGTVAAKAAAEISRETHEPADTEDPVVRGGAAGQPAEGSREGAGTQDDGLAPVLGARFAELPLDDIVPNPRQPREVFDDEKLSELVSSIKEVGLLQPVVVRQTGPERYELIMGERRWRAARAAGLERIPAIVRATEDDKLLLDALLENLHRAELNPLEEGAAYDQLLRDFSCTHDQLADRIGRSRSHVTNTLRMLKLAPAVQSRLASGVLSAGHARALLGLPDAAQQEELAQRIVKEGISVRSTEEIVRVLGQEETRQRPIGPKAGKLISPAFNDLAGRLSDRFETRVKVEVSQRGGKLGKGKVVLEFASVEDLNRILDSLAPGDDGLRLSS